MQASASSEIFTTVKVTGVARAPYDMVAFSVQIEGDGKTLADAKKKIDERVQLVEELVKKLVDTGVLRIEAGSEKRLPSTHYGMDYDKKSPVKKTICRYTYSFASGEIRCADAVMDALLTLGEGIISNLAHKVRDLDPLSKRAFADAVSKGRARFAEECRVIGVSRNRFVVSDYMAQYDESEKYRGPSAESAGIRKAAVISSMDDGGSPIRIDPGLAEIRVQLSMSFARKKTSMRASKSSAKKK